MLKEIYGLGWLLVPAVAVLYIGALVVGARWLYLTW